MSRAAKLSILLEKLLVNELGNYQYPNGEKKPAIRIVPPQISQLTMADDGVECLIYDKPRFNSPELLCENLGTPQYHVQLIQHQTDNTLENCQRLISKLFRVSNWHEQLQDVETVESQRQTEEQIVFENANFLLDEERFRFDESRVFTTINQIIS